MAEQKNHLLEANIFQYMPQGVMLTPYSTTILQLLQRALHRFFSGQHMYRIEIGYRRRRVSHLLKQTSHVSADPLVHSYLKQAIQSYQQLPLGLYTKYYRPLTMTRQVMHDLDFIYYNGYIAVPNDSDAEVTRAGLLQDIKKIFNTYAALDVLSGRDPITNDWRLACVCSSNEIFNLLHVEVISQNKVAKVGIKYRTKSNRVEYPALVQFSTGSNVLGKIIEAHQDARGIVLPAELAPIQVILVPVVTKTSQVMSIRRRVVALEKLLQAANIRTFTDWGPHNPGKKYHYWDLLGVPVRIEIGEDELKSKVTTIIDRHSQLRRQVKQGGNIVTVITQLLKNLHSDLVIASRNRHQAIPLYDPGEDSSPQETVVKAYFDATSANLKKLEKDWHWRVVLIDIDPGRQGKCIVTGQQAPLALLKKLS